MKTKKETQNAIQEVLTINSEAIEAGRSETSVAIQEVLNINAVAIIRGLV